MRSNADQEINREQPGSAKLHDLLFNDLEQDFDRTIFYEIKTNVSERDRWNRRSIADCLAFKSVEVIKPEYFNLAINKRFMVALVRSHAYQFLTEGFL